MPMDGCLLLTRLNGMHVEYISTTAHYFIDMESTRMATELKTVGPRAISTKTSMVRGAPMPVMGDVARANPLEHLHVFTKELCLNIQRLCYKLCGMENLSDLQRLVVESCIELAFTGCPS